MSTYSNRLQPALQNLLQHVVRFFHPRSSCMTHTSADVQRITLNGSLKEPNISIYFCFSPITQWCSISDVLFTAERGVSDFSVLKYY